MTAKEARHLVDVYEANDNISTILIRISEVASRGNTYLRVFGLTKGQRKALRKLGYKIGWFYDDYVNW